MKLLSKALLALSIFASSALATINLNTATKEELMSLDGIGESKAEAIIEYRKTNKFQSIDDLKNVKGIGDKTYENLKDELSTSGTTTISDTAKQKAKSKMDDSIDAASKTKATKKTKDSASSNSDEIKQKATKKTKKTKDEMIDEASSDTKQKTSKNTKENITDKAKSDTKKTIEKSKKAKDDMLEADTEGKKVK